MHFASQIYPIDFYGESSSSRRFCITRQVLYQGKHDISVQCKDVGSHSTCQWQVYPVGTLLWKVSQILSHIFATNFKGSLMIVNIFPYGQNIFTLHLSEIAVIAIAMIALCFRVSGVEVKIMTMSHVDLKIRVSSVELVYCECWCPANFGLNVAYCMKKWANVACRNKAFMFPIKEECKFSHHFMMFSLWRHVDK